MPRRTSLKKLGGKRKRRSGSKKESKKGSKRKPKRQANPTLLAMAEFNKYLVKELGVKFGKGILKLAKHYRELAKKDNPDADTIALCKLAKDFFKKDKNALERYNNLSK